MKNEFNKLIELGFSHESLEDIEESWNSGIVDYISQNIDTVCKNIKFIINDFSKDQILKFCKFYSDSFAISNTDFKKYIKLLKKSCDDSWQDIIINQFRGYNGYDDYIPFGTVDRFIYEPYLSIISTQNEDGIAKSIDSICNTEKRIYSFIVMLNKDFDLGIENTDFSDYKLSELECGKYEVLYNAENLLSMGLTKDALIDLLVFCPYMVETEESLTERLIEKFGNNYIKKMNSKEEKYELEDMLLSM